MGNGEFKSYESEFAGAGTAGGEVAGAGRAPQVVLGAAVVVRSDIPQARV